MRRPSCQPQPLAAVRCAPAWTTPRVDATHRGHHEEVDYERIGEREMRRVVFRPRRGRLPTKFRRARQEGSSHRATARVILDAEDVDAAKAAVEAIKDIKPILNGANKDNFAAMNAIATAAGIVLGVHGADLPSTSCTTPLPKPSRRPATRTSILDVTAATVKETFANAVHRPPLRHQGRRPHLRLSVHRQPRQSSARRDIEHLADSALASVFTF